MLKKKTILYFFPVLLLVYALIGSVFYFLDDFKIKHFTSHHSPRQEWEIPPLTEQESHRVNEILSQTFTFLGEGGQSYVFISADGKYVLKFFKFRRFRPTFLVDLLPDVALFSSYKSQHTAKREKKWLAAFNGHQWAHMLHRQESGLIYMQLNPGPNQKIKLIDKLGFKRSINVEKIPYVVQIRAETLGNVLERLLDHAKVNETKDKINQLFNLYLSEYHKGIYDIDYGVMHNIGVVDDHLIHLDVGKMVYDEKIKNPVFYQFDLAKVASKVKSWITKNYPLYADEITQHMEERLSARFDRKFTFPKLSDIEECKNVFESDIYTNYAKQRKEFLTQHPLYEKVKNSSDPYMTVLIEKIEMPLGDPLEQRQNHIAIVNLIRQPSITSLKEDSRQLFSDLIRWTFLQADIQTEMKTFLFEQATSIPKGLSQIINETFLRFKEDPRFDSVKHDSSYEDQFLEGNLPTRIAQIKKTTLIRFGQPLGVSRTFTSWFLSPNLSLEFLYFVQQQSSHLYVNLMKREGTERPLSQTLERLEEQIPGLYVVSLDKNSSFYWQKDEPENMKSSAFKQVFMDNLASKSFYWTRYLNKDEWTKDLQAILEGVHRRYFKNSESLTHAERQDFIELSYLAILDRLIEKFSPASMNISCRQAIDRAPSLIALWMLQKKQFDDREITAQLLAPPVVIHNRPSHPSRIERFLSAAKRLQD